MESKVKLSKYSTFKIGGYTDKFLEVKDEKELISIIKKCLKENIEYRVIGKGSNILFKDELFAGLVICFSSSFSSITNKKNIYLCQAGTALSSLVNLSINNGHQGLELLIGIPGSVGGAIYGNAGSHGQSISDNLLYVICLKEGKIKKIKKKDLKFSYRYSSFKENKDIILYAAFKLKKDKKENLLKISKEEIEKRRKNFPKYPNIGCIFKNQKESAGKLIDKCGLKGKVVGGVRVSLEHANIIENFNKGTSKDVKELIDIIKKEVYEKEKILLEEEIIIW